LHYSGICKLLALVLSAALLCTALASGMAVFSLNEAGLYQHSFEDAYNARRDGGIHPGMGIDAGDHNGRHVH
jgi:hypothetical protein